MYSCKYCNKNFKKFQSLGGHVVYCIKRSNNRNREKQAIRVSKWQKEKFKRKHGKLIIRIKKCYNCNQNFEIEEYELDNKIKYFCSKFCAHSYSTKAKRKEINKKVSKKLKGRRYVPYEIRTCVICNKPFECMVSAAAKCCKRECSILLRAISNRGVSRNKGKNNPMYGKAPKTSNYNTGKFYSKKNSMKIFYRSSYELKALKILESDEQVISYEYESFNIPYDEHHSTIPDFLVKYKNKTLLLEIKPKIFIDAWNNTIKIDAMRQYAKRNDLIFEIWTEKELGFI